MVLVFWRRRRDLNPRDTFAPYSLSRGAPSPLGYFSISIHAVFHVASVIFQGDTDDSSGGNLIRPCHQNKWRRGWDSNPRALSDKRFSRPPRYDHFDTSPYRISVLRRTYYSMLLVFLSTPFSNSFKLSTYVY